MARLQPHVLASFFRLPVAAALLGTLALSGALSGPAEAADAKAKAKAKEKEKDDEKDKDKARTHANKGNTAYNLGNFKEAAEHYEQAYRLIQDENVLFNVGQSYRQADEPEKALAAYKGFLRTAPPKHPNRKQAEEHVAALQKGPAETPAPPPPPEQTTPGASGSSTDAANEFNPFSGAPEDDNQDDGGETTGNNVIRRLNPTAGGMLMLANQPGVQGGDGTHFQAFARVHHNGREYEAGYMDLPFFIPNPVHSTSAVYFRFASDKHWWAQAGALGRNGNFHAAGGMNWDHLGVGAWVENIGGFALCGDSSGRATYISPVVNLRIPVIPGITAHARGIFRQKVFVSDACSFTPSMANLDAGVDWSLREEFVFTGGVGLYQFFGLDNSANGPWGDITQGFAAQGFAGVRYNWRKHLAFIAHYRRIFYDEGVNMLTLSFEASLGEL